MWTSQTFRFFFSCFWGGPRTENRRWKLRLTGITTIYRPSTYYQQDIFDQLDAREISDADWHAATTGNVLGALPPPLALVQVRARRHRNEIAQQHARVQGSKMPVDQLDNIKMSRLRLTLVDGHRVNPTVWAPESTVRLPPNEAGNPCVLRPCFWDLAPPLGAVCVIDTKGTNSLTTCMFLSLFALWCWRLKVAYSKLIFGQRRAFRNKKEEPEGLWGSTRPELFVFIDRAQNVRPTKLR